MIEYSDASQPKERMENDMKNKLIAWLTIALMLLTVNTAFAEEMDYKDQYPESLVFESIWKTGDWQIESYCEDAGFKLMVKHQLAEGKYTVWEYSAIYQAENNTLVCMPFGIKYTEDTNSISGTLVNEYEDGDAIFSLDAKGRLLWKDLKEDAGRGLAFTKIGMFLGGNWIKDQTMVEFVDWQDGVYEVRVTVFDQSGLANKYGVLKGAYSSAQDAVTVNGIMEGDSKPVTITFSFNENGLLVWKNEATSEVIVFGVDESAG